MKFWRRRRNRKLTVQQQHDVMLSAAQLGVRRKVEAAADGASRGIRKSQTFDLGDDPLDPHGDGTIRPGDPMWDLMFGPTLASRNDDGTWDVET